MRPSSGGIGEVTDTAVARTPAELRRLLKIDGRTAAIVPTSPNGDLESASWAVFTFASPPIRCCLLITFSRSDELLGLCPAVAGHPPRPPTDGFWDLQASIADCNCGEPDWMPESCTSLPENVGSGKSDTPWTRMH